MTLAQQLRVDRVFKALADPTRRRLYERLVREEESVAQLTRAAGVSQPTISQHVAVLREAGLLAARNQGRVTFYRADPKALGPLLHWVDVQHGFWRTALGRLDTLLKENEK